MNRRVSTRIALCLLIAVTLAPAAFARGKKTPATTEPGTYKQWGPDIDEIEITKKFTFADYKKIVVEPVDTSAADTKDKAVEEVAGVATKEFADQLAKEVKPAVEVEAKPEKSGGTLVLRTKVVSMDPGSRAKRYVASFGAGAAIVKMEGEIVDAKSNKMLARFTQERRSGFGIADGNSASLMRRDIRAIAIDVANILKAF